MVVVVVREGTLAADVEEVVEERVVVAIMVDVDVDGILMTGGSRVVVLGVLGTSELDTDEDEDADEDEDEIKRVY